MPRKNKEEENVQEKDVTLEESFKELDRIIAALEQSDVSLEESFQLYHKGMDVLKHCNSCIDKIEKELIVLEESGI